MTNAYCDLATLKSGGALNITGAAHDARLLALLEESSRWIDACCNRHFYLLHATRRFDGGGGRQLQVPDLVGVTSLKTLKGGEGGEGRESGNPAGSGSGSGVGEVWGADDYRLYPLNAEPGQPWGRPYTRLLVNPDSSAKSRFPQGSATVEIAGKWGFQEVTADSGTVIKDNSPIGPSDTRLMVKAAVSRNAGAVTVSAGHTLAIGEEQLYVTGQSGQSGQMEAELTVQRGVNGTAAASHDAGAAVAVYRYPTAVAEACLQLASQLWQDRGYTPIAAGGGRTGVGGGPGRGLAVERLLDAYRKLPVGVGL